MLVKALKRANFTLPLLVLSLGLFNSSCKSFNERQDKLKLQREGLLSAVFFDFTFVGSGGSSELTPPHGIENQPLPRHIAEGQSYIFHRAQPMLNETIFENLQTRLKSYGVEVQTSSGTTYRMNGGLLFRINFHSETFKGYIINRTDPQLIRTPSLSAKWMIDDYLLVFE